MVQDRAETGEYFQVRRLLWDELKLNVRASEEQELRGAIGSSRIAENEELRQELAVLVEILAEFQQQNDDIRHKPAIPVSHGLYMDARMQDALTKRQHVPEPPGRQLLLEKLKLLAADMRRQPRHVTIQSAKDVEILEYVLSTADDSGQYSYRQAPMTPRMDDAASGGFPCDLADGVALRPGTANGKRPTTGGSQRPVSRGSTVSVSSITAVLETSAMHHRFNLEEIDAIKGDLQETLIDERQLLLEDIDFIQDCLEMEKDLIDDDRRKVAEVKPPPSLSELHEFRKTLEKTLEDQEEVDKLESILNKANGAISSARGGRILTPVPPPEPSAGTLFHTRGESAPSAQRPLLSTLRPTSSSPSSSSLSRCRSATKVLKIRHIVQESRDEPYLS